MALTFYCSVAKGLKVKVEKFWGLITFIEVTGEKLIRGHIIANLMLFKF